MSGAGQGRRTGLFLGLAAFAGLLPNLFFGAVITAAVFLLARRVFG